MTFKRKASIFFSMIAWLAAACYISTSAADASTFQIKIQNSKIDIEARQVPLIDLLKAISTKTGVTFRSGDPLAENVSLTLKNASIEQCLRRLLRNRNYALTYKKIGENQIVPATIHIYGTGSVTMIKPGDQTEPSPVPLEDPLRKIERESIEQALGKATILAKQIEGRFVSDSPEKTGIKVTRVAEKSLFSEIGLKKGDIVQDVNGQQVETTEDLIEALQTATKAQPEIEAQPGIEEAFLMIRIARIKGDVDLMDPIYIELR